MVLTKQFTRLSEFTKLYKQNQGRQQVGDRGDKSPPLLKVGGGGDIISFVPPPHFFGIKPITENMKSTSKLLFCVL